MDYKDVKIAALVRRLAQIELAEQARNVDAAYSKVLIANGLDPTKNYRFNDVEGTVLEDPGVPPVG